ncbi:MAG: hypothetical protein V4576_01100 [Patescibacteria group bacterium]
MKWKHPPTIKIYEALGSVADGRVEISANTAKVYSSSRNKYYDVVYDPENKLIMTNDNGSYWKGYCGYPAIAYLMNAGVLSYDEKLGNLLKGIEWKDINQKFKNDFDKTMGFIFSTFEEKDKKELEEFALKAEGEIKDLDLGLLGKKMLPPEGY